MEGSWEDLMPTISFCGKIKHTRLNELPRDSWRELLAFQMSDGPCISEEVMADALTSEHEDWDIYLRETTATAVTKEDPQKTDILADAFKSAFGEDEDLGVYLEDDRPDTPFSQCDVPSPCSSTTSGVLSCYDYESLSPWSVGSPASPRIISMEPNYVVIPQQQQQPRILQHSHSHQQMHLQLPHQMFQVPNNSKRNTRNVDIQQRQPVPMRMTTVDPKLATWLSQQIPASSNNQKPSKKMTRPSESYVSLIAKAILSLPTGRALLSDIYQFSIDTYDYYRSAPKTWKNAIRHNLSVNECFVKNGRAPHGRGYYWSVHPACVQSFLNGDFRRREAMNLANGSDRVQQQQQQAPIGYHHNFHQGSYYCN